MRRSFLMLALMKRTEPSPIAKCEPFRCLLPGAEMRSQTALDIGFQGTGGGGVGGVFGGGGGGGIQTEGNLTLMIEPPANSSPPPAFGPGCVAHAQYDGNGSSGGSGGESN